MDKVLKQRLIGASILIALAVIFVPMLFDGPDSDPVSRELNIELPSAPSDREPIRRLPLDPDQARTTAQTDRSASLSEGRSQPIEPPRIQSDATDSAMGVDNDPDNQSGSNDAPQIDDTDREDTASPEAGLVEREAETGPSDSISDEAVASVPEDARWAAPEPPAAAPAEQPEPVSSEPAETTGFEVQVASFGSRENAEVLVDQLTRLGHVATIDIVVRGPSELHRVRTGPYADRDDAERALNQISQTVAGVSPVIVGSSSGPSTVTDAGFAVQVGSFASRDNALRLLDQLGNRNYEAFIHQDQAGSRTIWRVRVGPLGTRPDAVQRLERLIDDGIDGLVVSHP